MRDLDTGEYILQEFEVTLSGTTMTISKAQRQVFEGSGFITSDSKFWRLRASSYLYFSSGSKLYFYDINTRRVKLYTDLGEGTITHMRQDADGTRIGVATNTGRFFLFDATTVAVLGADDPGAEGLLHTLDGLGEIIDLDWKYGGYYTYSGNRY